MNKLKIEHLPLLVGYLPYKLKLRIEREGRFIGDPNVIEREIWNIHDINILFNKRYRTVSVKPILKPMEMFDYKDWRDGYCNLEFEIDPYIQDNLSKASEFNEDAIEQTLFRGLLLNYLYQNHYDIHGLIGKGLAVDWREIDEI